MTRKTRSQSLRTSAGPIVAQNAPGSSNMRPDGHQRPVLTEKELHDKSAKVLELIDELGLDFGTFVHGVCYGNPQSRDHEPTKAARRSFTQTDKLAGTLQNLYKPPRPPKGGGNAPFVAKKILIEFASTTMTTVYRDELSELGKTYRVPKDVLADPDELAKITAESLHADMSTKCPKLFNTLATLAGDEVEKPNAEADQTTGIRPHPHFGTITTIASLACRSNRLNNTLPYILGFYMHAKHTSKPVFNLLHQAGIVVSYTTIMNAVEKMSEEKRIQAIEAALNHPIVVVHDNIRIAFKVASQRGDNQSTTDNGTGISIIVLPLSATEFFAADDFGPFLRQLKAQRIADTAKHLSWADISNIERQKRVRNDYFFDILDFLRMVPGMDKLKVLRSNILNRTPGPQQLPHGKEHRTQFFMLPTINQEEMTYSGNSQIIPFVLNYLELTKGDARDKLAIERLVPWVGDQTTVQRCRGVQWFRGEDRNSIDRFEPLVFIFGLFHCEMALAAGVFETSRGTSSGPTFASDVVLLSRTGLQANMNKKRPDFHTVDEFLQHEAEAHFRGIFLMETGTESNEELVAWVETHTAEEILELVTRIHTIHASSGALYRLERSKSTDEARPTTIIQNRDLLLYYAFRTANKHGRIDRIEDLLPEMMIYFAGSGNSNYAREVWEFLQLITYQCTPNVRKAIMRYCLLVNMAGRGDSFYPIDQRQEHNNAGIRDYGPPPQNSSWEQYKKVSPVIPFYLDIVKHVEEKVSGIKRSHIHKDPKREADVQILIRAHQGRKMHKEDPERKIDKANEAKDCVNIGSKSLKSGKLQEYANKRKIYYNALSDEQTFSDVDTPSTARAQSPNPDESVIDLDLDTGPAGTKTPLEEAHASSGSGHLEDDLELTPEEFEIALRLGHSVE